MLDPAPPAGGGVAVSERRRPAIGAVVFDVGGVLVDWDPRHLYRKLFDDSAAMERFLTSVCSPRAPGRGVPGIRRRDLGLDVAQ